MVNHRLVGSITRSYRPGGTLGALTFSVSHSGSCASSSSQFQKVLPARYSHPRAVGGAQVRMLSNDPAARSTAIAVTWGCIRTRCWVVLVPAESAENLVSFSA